MIMLLKTCKMHAGWEVESCGHCSSELKDGGRTVSVCARRPGMRLSDCNHCNLAFVEASQVFQTYLNIFFHLFLPLSAPLY